MYPFIAACPITLLSTLQNSILYYVNLPYGKGQHFVFVVRETLHSQHYSPYNDNDEYATSTPAAAAAAAAALILLLITTSISVQSQ